LEYRYSSIEELSGALRARTVSSVELSTEAIRLLDTIGRRFNAVANTLDARARAAAEHADAMLAEGSAHSLCGVPYGVKDLFSASGGPTTWGSPAFEHQVIDSDAEVVSRLGRVGAVLTAKLSLSELAGGGSPKMPGASLHGAGINPWNQSLYSGGSSSGSAIAVCLGLVPFALGTETGGSVLWPSAFTGVVGLRTTKGRVPRAGAMTLSATLDKVGIIARSATDCAIVLHELAGPPTRASEAPTADGLTVVFDPAEVEEAEPGMREALTRALDEFLSSGCRVVPNTFPRRPEFISALKTIIAAEGAFEFRTSLRDPGFEMTDETQQENLRSGLDVALEDYLEARLTTRSHAKSAFEEVFDNADVILSITRTEPTPVLNEPRRPRDEQKLADILAAAGNLAGVPGLTMPAGLGSDGSPVGIQVIGPRGADETLLAIAREFQSRTGYHELRPDQDGSTAPDESSVPMNETRSPSP
jgi:aspartyl-tRNA(Asn)/glutamyl-tRNA(Gln) amidotransferase subunit A